MTDEKPGNNLTIQEIVITGQNQVELQSNNLNTTDLAPFELLIETERTFISTGTELANYTAKDPMVFQAGSWCAYPWRSGYANVGLVQAVGSQAARAKVGDRVFTYGQHASLIRYSEERLVAPVPPDIDPAIAAVSRMAAVAATAVIVSQIPSNGWVVIFGLGLVGNLAAQMFQAKGCRVIGVDPVHARRKLAARCGLTHAVGGDLQAVQEAIAEISQGHLADISVDAVGHSAVVMEALKATATHGQLILLGTPRVPVEGNLTELLGASHRRWITIRGALEWCIPMYPPAAGNHISQYGKQQLIFDWIRRGTLQLAPLISHRMRPEQIKAAYEGLLNQPDLYTGVVLDWANKVT